MHQGAQEHTVMIITKLKEPSIMNIAVETLFNGDIFWLITVLSLLVHVPNIFTEGTYTLKNKNDISGIMVHCSYNNYMKKRVPVKSIIYFKTRGPTQPYIADLLT